MFYCLNRVNVNLGLERTNGFECHCFNLVIEKEWLPSLIQPVAGCLEES